MDPCHEASHTARAFSWQIITASLASVIAAVSQPREGTTITQPSFPRAEHGGVASADGSLQFRCSLRFIRTLGSSACGARGRWARRRKRVLLQHGRRIATARSAAMWLLREGMMLVRRAVLRLMGLLIRRPHRRDSNEVS